MPESGTIVTPASLVTYPVAFGVVKGGFELAKAIGEWGKSPLTALVIAAFVSAALVFFSGTGVTGSKGRHALAAFFLIAFNTVVLASAAFGIGTAAEEAADRLSSE